MAEGKIEIWRCIKGGVCPLDSIRNHGYGSYTPAVHEICKDLPRCWAADCTRTEVQTDREREKLVKEKESHIEPSLSSHTHTHTHTQPRCPDCQKGILKQNGSLNWVHCDNCMTDFFLQYVEGEVE